MQSDLQALGERMRAAQRRKAKRRFLAFLVIVAYGGIVGNFARNQRNWANHPTLVVWFWAVVLGFAAFAFVDGLLHDDEDDE